MRNIIPGQYETLAFIVIVAFKSFKTVLYAEATPEL